MSSAKRSINMAFDAKQDATTPAKAGRPKSLEKRDKILDAASCLFLEQGFSPTSMDMVAKKAEVSKQTVYSHFSNKDALFIAVIDKKCHEYQLDEMDADVSGCPKELLTRFATQFVSLLHDPQASAMYRVVIGEVGNNQHVAEMFYDTGILAGYRILKGFLCSKRELNLSEEKAHRLTIAFFNLLKSDFFMPAMLGLPFDDSPEHQETEIAWAVDQFIRMIRED